MSSETSKPVVTWSQNHTDFTIVVKSSNGQQLMRVHKHVLSDNSTVFKTMLDQDMLETNSNQVEIKQFDVATVTSFLEYIYAYRVEDKKLISLVRAADGPDKYFFRRPGFQQDKFTVDLMSMAHYYGVQDLLTDCAEYLKDKISDDNVMKIWTEADKFELKSLCATALEHLTERPIYKPLKDVPGFKDAFGAQDTPLKELLSILTEKNSSLKDTITGLKDKNSRLKDKNSRLKDKVSELKDKVSELEESSGGGHWHDQD